MGVDSGKARTGLPRRPRGHNDHLVLGALTRAGKPLGAYELLGQLREAGLRSPLQIYRALDRLIAAGSVHKIASLSAYTACSDAACGRHCHAVFAVCTRCGQATEMHAPSLAGLLVRVARDQRFQMETTTVELSGLCESCVHA